MAFRSAIASKLPMVIILGATGTGKTKLSLELAQKFESEIISADSMQIYKGLDIVTAKASPRERDLVPHHLVDILEPHQMFTVVDFRNRALKLIENLMERGKIPIIVGGTNYYIESIVYKILVEDTDDSNNLLWDKTRRKRNNEDYTTEENHSKALKVDDKSDCSPQSTSDCVPKDVEDKNKSEAQPTDIDRNVIQKDVDNEIQFTNEEIHAKLKAIDPEMASRLHPNNRRKVLRSIEVWLKTGRRHSEVLDEQKLSEGHLRRPNSTIIFWLTCEQSVHNERLNARVDCMLQEGLIEELLSFHDRHNKQRIKDGGPPDYTKGVFQTLGFKEFHEYLMLPDEKRNSEESKKLLLDSVENMKMATRRYAHRQNKMIKGRFLEHPTREVAPIFELDTTVLSKWDEEVKCKAIKIIKSYLSEQAYEYTPLTSNISEDKKQTNRHSSNYCQICERLIIGDKEFTIHINSQRHMRALKKKNKLAAAANKVAEQEQT